MEACSSGACATVDGAAATVLEARTPVPCCHAQTVARAGVVCVFDLQTRLSEEESVVLSEYLRDDATPSDGCLLCVLVVMLSVRRPLVHAHLAYRGATSVTPLHPAAVSVQAAVASVALVAAPTAAGSWSESRVRGGCCTAARVIWQLGGAVARARRRDVMRCYSAVCGVCRRHGR